MGEVRGDDDVVFSLCGSTWDPVVLSLLLGGQLLTLALVVPVGGGRGLVVWWSLIGKPTGPCDRDDVAMMMVVVSGGGRCAGLVGSW